MVNNGIGTVLFLLWW